MRKSRVVFITILIAGLAQAGMLPSQLGLPVPSMTYLSRLTAPNNHISILTQIRDPSANDVLLTVNSTGGFALFFYVNEELGYLSPLDGNLLYCQEYQPTLRALQLPLIDCWANGNIADIPDSAVYQSTGKTMRFGDSFYYSDGRELRDFLGNWYYSDSYHSVFYDFFENNYYWPQDLNGTHLLRSDDIGSFTFYYKDGSQLFSSLSQATSYYSRGQGFFSEDGFKTNYPLLEGSGDIVTESFKSRIFHYPSFAVRNLAEMIDNKELISYPSGLRLKEEFTPFYGTVYTETQFPTARITLNLPYPPLSTPPVEDPAPEGGLVLIDATQDQDFVGIFQYEGKHQIVHAVMQNRVASALPAQPVDIHLHRRGPAMELSWATPPSRVGPFEVKYLVQYSTDLRTWKTSTVAAVPLQLPNGQDGWDWIDAGPPATGSAPEKSSTRFYRVLSLP